MGYMSKTIPFPKKESGRLYERIPSHYESLTPNREYCNRPNLPPFAKKPKTTPIKRSNMETKCKIKKLYKPRKADKGYSEMFQYNGLAQTKTVETVPQNHTVTKPALVAIPIQEAPTTVTYVQPVTIPAAVPTQPMVTTSGQPQQFPNFYA